MQGLNVGMIKTESSSNKIGAKKKCINGIIIGSCPKITCAKFGVNMFVWARDMAANVIYFTRWGDPVHSSDENPEYSHF